MKKQPYPKPSQSYLKDWFLYNAEHGVLLWARSKGARAAGDLAGVRTDRYVMVRIEGVLHNARDLIWIWHYGEMPLGGLVHIDNNVFNNRIENLTPRKEVARRMHDFKHRNKEVSFF